MLTDLLDDNSGIDSPKSLFHIIGVGDLPLGNVYEDIVDLQDFIQIFLPRSRLMRQGCRKELGDILHAIPPLLYFVLVTGDLDDVSKLEFALTKFEWESEPRISCLPSSIEQWIRSLTSNNHLSIRNARGQIAYLI